VLAQMCMVGMASSDGEWLVVVFPCLFIFGLILLHTLNMARSFVRTKKIRDDGDNTAWIFRGVWPCCILFTVIETALTLGYFVGACAVIIISINFF
jgi:hypothetical protein